MISRKCWESLTRHDGVNLAFRSGMLSAPAFNRPLLDRRTPVRVASLEAARALLSQLTAEDLLAGRVVVSRNSLPKLDALSAVSAPMLSSLAGAL